MIKRLTSHFMSFNNSELSAFRASSVIAVYSMQDAIVKTELMSPLQVRPFSPPVPFLVLSPSKLVLS